jgi:predicted nucleotide-binding protein
MTFRRLIGGRAAMSNADALDIVFRPPPARRSHRVFITRRDSGNVLEHVKELVACGQFEPVVARERGMAGRALLHDLIEQMRGCDTAIIHVTADAVSADADRQPRISGDVLVEIGAAMALYGHEFVLLVEDAIELPPLLHGLCVCRCNGNELNVPAMMRLLRAFRSFTKWPSGRPSAISGASSAFGYPQQADKIAAKH